MASTRYTNVVNQIKADLRQERGREVSAERLDEVLEAAIGWFMDLHPDRWPWSHTQITTSGEDEDVEVRANTGTYHASFAPEPQTNGILVVKTQLNAATGDWKVLKHVPWVTMQNRPGYNRSATTTANQSFWSLKYVGTATAEKVPTISIETFPNSYATAILYYQVDYRIKTPEVDNTSNPDDAFLWEDASWDLVVAYFAETMLAHELNLEGMFARAWGLARELARRILKGSGVEESRIKVSPPYIIRETELSDGGS